MLEEIKTIAAITIVETTEVNKETISWIKIDLKDEDSIMSMMGGMVTKFIMTIVIPKQETLCVLHMQSQRIL